MCVREDVGRVLCAQIDAAGAQPGNRSCLNFEAAEDPNWLFVIWYLRAKSNPQQNVIPLLSTTIARALHPERMTISDLCFSNTLLTLTRGYTKGGRTRPVVNDAVRHS